MSEVNDFLYVFGDWSRGESSFPKVLKACPTPTSFENVMPADLPETGQASTAMHEWSAAGRAAQTVLKAKCTTPAPTSYKNKARDVSETRQAFKEAGSVIHGMAAEGGKAIDHNILEQTVISPQGWVAR